MTEQQLSSLLAHTAASAAIRLKKSLCPFMKLQCSTHRLAWFLQNSCIGVTALAL